MRFPIYAKPRLEKLLGEAVAKCIELGEECSSVPTSHLSISKNSTRRPSGLLSFFPRNGAITHS
jgi:hypothetical protein